MKNYILLSCTGVLMLVAFKSHQTNMQTMTHPTQILHISIKRSFSDVYAYLSNAKNFPTWAAGLGSSFKETSKENTWSITTANGPATVRFVEKNTFGIVDHYVNTPDGQEVYIPLRVIQNNTGSEVIFTLFRLPGVTDEQFKKDREAVQKDLNTLKQVLEKQ